jgi:hypothetical protein
MHAWPPQERIGWFGRIRLFTRFLLALIFFWAGFWLQSCAVRAALDDSERTRTRAQALRAMHPLTVSTETVDRRNDGRLVHVTGRLDLDEPLVDSQMGVTANALVLERHVEIYQWEEDPSPSPTSSGSYRRRRHRTRGEYSPPPPRLVWSPQRLSSLSDIEAGDMGTLLRPQSARFRAYGKLRLGAFRIANMSLPSELTEAREPLVLSPSILEDLPEPLRGKARLHDGGIQVGDPASPVAGDYRLRYLLAPASQEVTVIADQVHGALMPHEIPGAYPLAIIQPGRHAAGDLLKDDARVTGNGWFGAALVLGVPFFAMGALLLYRPACAAGRVLPGVRVLVEPGGLAFVPLITVSVALGAVAYVRWSHGAPGASRPAAVALVALGALVVLGTRLLERQDRPPEEARGWTPIVPPSDRKPL